VKEEETLPEPAPGEARIRVLATSAAFTDTMIRKGIYPGVKEKPPFSPGYDMIGIVDKLGEGATFPAVGQTVADLTVIGAYSEYLCLEADRLVPVPNGLDPAEAVSLILSYITAYQMLHRKAHIRRGQRILIHGAGGAVGTALLQLGRILDLKMYATASAPKHEMIQRFGAIPIDYRAEDFAARIRQLEADGVDAAFDAIGGDHFKRSFSTLRRGGILVAYGFYNAATGRGGNAALDFIRPQLWNVLPNGKSATFYSIAPWRKKHPDWFREDLSALFEMLSRREIEPVIEKRMPLMDAQKAHELIDKAAVTGKLVLMVGDN
jgi:NADPH:quinone reductase-like Zn-dependent oxidoreductase